MFTMLGAANRRKPSPIANPLIDAPGWRNWHWSRDLPVDPAHTAAAFYISNFNFQRQRSPGPIPAALFNEPPTHRVVVCAMIRARRSYPKVQVNLSVEPARPDLLHDTAARHLPSLS
jgi:hypothetical protein